MATFILSAVSIHPASIDLSIAASLKEVVTELSNDFANMKPAVSFKRNTGAPGALATQIENGAPCDIFFSANADWADYLMKKKLADAGSISVLAFNELVFVGKSGLKVNGLNDVVTLKKIAIGSPKSVPAGEYAMEAFTKADLVGRLKYKLVMAKDVRECLMYAERGEVDGAFVYRTDAAIASRNVKILFIVPQRLYRRITYTMTLTGSGAGKKEAADFYRFMHSAHAKKVLVKYGFAVK
ncbi:MAG TPA: molybdate ABC transporter substrate-binding protein [Spirochaetota bacterium]|nr:molybdate ABC transporter substrate-binding protein [Spirochaetota bacterium]HPC39993.1 molybdate ABC transporter substrate-binding protein [Spirochaetota bacterium]HPL16626.1 molybdate ABC transporter substrate-binding protein [Spirochaetota bacterium]HQF09810.1 molybdate ABC transporter substrate-binding protein [Spirochaetota bacterium]HQH98738.1 molybdate ABC transporter substrate-binding protein [Spirochaetota bacterium]